MARIDASQTGSTHKKILSAALIGILQASGASAQSLSKTAAEIESIANDNAGDVPSEGLRQTEQRFATKERGADISTPIRRATKPQQNQNNTTPSPSTLAENLRQQENMTRRLASVTPRQARNINEPTKSIDGNRFNTTPSANGEAKGELSAEDQSEGAETLRGLDNDLRETAKQRPKILAAKKNLVKTYQPLISAANKLKKVLKFTKFIRLVLWFLTVLCALTIIFIEVAGVIYGYNTRLKLLVKQIEKRQKALEAKIKEPRQKIDEENKKLAQANTRIRSIQAQKRAVEEDLAYRDQLSEAA